MSILFFYKIICDRQYLFIFISYTYFCLPIHILIVYLSPGKSQNIPVGNLVARSMNTKL